MTELTKKRLKYVGINGTFALAVWYGFKVGIPWVATITTGYLWFIAFFSLVTCGILGLLIHYFNKELVTTKVTEDLHGKVKEPYSVPTVLDIGFDVWILYMLYTFATPLLLGVYSVVAISSLVMRLQMVFVRNRCNAVIERNRDNERKERLNEWSTNSTDTFENDDDELFRMGIIDTTGSDN